MKSFKKLTAIIVAAIAAFVCLISFSGCELANNVQRDCNHSFVKQRHDSSLREATCSKEGISEVYKCWKCQKFEYVYSPALPHTFDEKVDKFDFNCKYSVVYVTQTCSVCNQQIMQQIKAICHDWGAGKHYDATDNEDGTHSCEHTDYGCRGCGKKISEYNHEYGEWNKELIDNYKAEAANGNCGVNLGVTCDACRLEESISFHDFSQEVEVLYSSSEYRIVKYKCKTCDDTETRVIYL